MTAEKAPPHFCPASLVSEDVAEGRGQQASPAHQRTNAPTHQHTT